MTSTLKPWSVFGCALVFLVLLGAMPAQVRAQESDSSSSEDHSTGEGAGRGRRLRRNQSETGMARVSVADQDIRITYGKSPMKGPDFKQFDSMKTGSFVKFISNAAIKMRTQGDLKFGETLVKAGNVAKNYPGVYTLWLKKVEGGWRLVFNSEGDTWGTQHNPAADVAEIPLTLKKLDTDTEVFTIDLKEENGAGLLRMAWGTFEWTAKFQASAPPAEAAVK